MASFASYGTGGLVIGKVEQLTALSQPSASRQLQNHPWLGLRNECQGVIGAKSELTQGQLQSQAQPLRGPKAEGGREKQQHPRHMLEGSEPPEGRTAARCLLHGLVVQ